MRKIFIVILMYCDAFNSHASNYLSCNHNRNSSESPELGPIYNNYSYYQSRK